MRLAIHRSSWGFSNDWIAYCQQRGMDVKVVSCYSSDIVKEIADCDALLWHHHHTGAKDILFAKQLLFALEQSGKKVFPDFNTGWHFDDKVGQKYLLEAINAPLVPSHVFYEKEKAFEFLEKCDYPVVFKLRGGAGSNNVRLVRSAQEGSKLVKKAFDTGFPAYNKGVDLRENIRRLRMGTASYIDLAKSVRRAFMSTRFAKISGPEIGYVLFQDFVPNNTFDIRVVVIDEKAFAIKRLTRDNDFRASGSGHIRYDKEEIPLNCVAVALDVTKKLAAQCVAYDFVFNAAGEPLIVEINYGFAHEAYAPCPGYWDKDLQWHAGGFNPAEWMIDLVVGELQKELNLNTANN